MNHGVDEQVEPTQTVTCLTKASTNGTPRWCVNLFLTRSDSLGAKTRNSSVYGLKTWMILNRRQPKCGKDAPVSLKTERSAEPLWKSGMVLTAGAPPRSGGWGWTTTPPGDPGCLFLHKGEREVLPDTYGRSPLIKDSLFFWRSSPMTAPLLHLPLHPYFMLNAQWKWHWWKSANYGVFAGFARGFF